MTPTTAVTMPPASPPATYHVTSRTAASTAAPTAARPRIASSVGEPHQALLHAAAEDQPVVGDRPDQQYGGHRGEDTLAR